MPQRWFYPSRHLSTECHRQRKPLILKPKPARMKPLWGIAYRLVIQYSRPTLAGSADVFVFPSKTDTFGQVMVEAMASGLPVAAFNTIGPVDVVRHGYSGALDDDDLVKACKARPASPCSRPAPSPLSPTGSTQQLMASQPVHNNRIAERSISGSGRL